ncbi:MAG: TlpA family protein disulfide reductase, partial [gamma proteobacterium symbiont of Ctena orbiculata]
MFSAAAETVDFELPGLDGKRYRLSDYRGKWVLVNYWATWCPSCREELPELEVFHNNHKDTDAVVLGVAMER